MTGVVIGLPLDTSPDQIQDLKAELQTQFPGVKFALITGVNGCLSFAFDAEQEES